MTRAPRIGDILLAGSTLAFATLGCAGAQQTGPAPASAAAAPAAVAPPEVPPAIAVPAGARVAARLHATGAQVYVCGAGPAAGAFSWKLEKPDATLAGEDGRAAGTHGAGPTWTSVDGSAVVGKKIAQADAPDATAVPWLLLGAVSTTGAGLFSDVTFVQRVSTSGGKAPPSGCGADNVGAETRAPYTADYYFYRGGK